MADKSEDELRPKVKRRFVFKNVSKRNVFTSVGRCMPGETVSLFVHEAKDFPALEKVSNA